MRSSSVVFAVLLGSSLSGLHCGPRSGKDTLTAVGQAAPLFEARTLEGQPWRLKDQRGQVVLLTFFATWCSACRAELPELESRVWEPFRERGLILLALGREQTAQELDAFRTQNRLTFDIAADSGRAAFGRYAAKGIPRNVLLDTSGVILFQSAGYDSSAFGELIEHVRTALETGRTRP